MRTSTIPPPTFPRPRAEEVGGLGPWLGRPPAQAPGGGPPRGRGDTAPFDRTEYQNAIETCWRSTSTPPRSCRPMKAVTASTTSPSAICRPTLLDRYISAAQKISRLAVGSTQSSLQSDIIRVRRSHAGGSHARACRSARAAACRCPIRSPRTASTTSSSGSRAIWQHHRVEGDGAARDAGAARSGAGRDLHGQSPPDGDDTLLDNDLKARVAGDGGAARARRHIPQELVVAARNGPAATAIALQRRRHPRTAPAIDQVSVTGPYARKGGGDTPSRRRIVLPTSPAGQDGQEETCAGRFSRR